MFDRKTLVDDLIAGTVVFLVALPLCLGVALASDAPLFSGIIAGVAGGIVTTLISQSRLGVSGPAAGLAVIVATAIGRLGYETFLLAVVIAGVLQIAAGFARAGVIGYYFPSAVIKGMLAGIGIVLVLKQIPHALGYDTSWMGEMEFVQEDGHNTFSQLYYAVLSIRPAAILVCMVGLGVLIAFEIRPLSKYKRRLRYLPAPLVVVVLGVAINEIYRRYWPGLALTGDDLVNLPVPESLRHLASLLTFPDFSQWNNVDVYRTALTIAIIASLETLLSVEATDKLDPDKRVTPTNLELKAQGVGNITAGLFGGIPVTQVVVRSSVNINAGGRSRLSALVHGVLLLLCATFIAAALNRIPLACLAAILIVTGYKLARASLFRSMYRLGFWQFAPFIVTVVAIVFTDLLLGITLGLVVALFNILQVNYRSNLLLEHVGERKYSIRLTEHMTFLNKAVLTRLLAVPRKGRHVTIDATASREVDHDVREVIQEFLVRAQSEGIDVEILGIDDLDATPIDTGH